MAPRAGDGTLVVLDQGYRAPTWNMATQWHAQTLSPTPNLPAIRHPQVGAPCHFRRPRPRRVSPLTKRASLLPPAPFPVRGPFRSTRLAARAHMLTPRRPACGVPVAWPVRARATPTVQRRPAQGRPSGRHAKRPQMDRARDKKGKEEQKRLSRAAPDVAGLGRDASGGAAGPSARHRPPQRPTVHRVYIPKPAALHTHQARTRLLQPWVLPRLMLWPT